MSLPSVFLSSLAAAAFTVSALAQTPAAPPAGTQTSGPVQAQDAASPPSKIGAGVVIPAQLSKSVDAKKAKPGDKIEAKTTMDLLSHGQVVIPRDTKVIGHVTTAKPHSKESPDSSVGLAFDRISMKDGTEVPVKASVQAIGRPLSAFAAPTGESAGAPAGSMPSSGAPDSRGTMGGSQAGAQRPNNGSPSSSYPSNAPSQTPSGAAGAGTPGGAVLEPHSQGVIGMKGLQLNSSGDGSVVSSADNNVHLDSGTQLVLRTE